MEPPKVQCTGAKATFAYFSFALKQPAALISGRARCRAIFYTPTAFAFGDQRFRRWIASGYSPVFFIFSVVFFVSGSKLILERNS